MKKTGVFYGSSSGNTKSAAGMIANKLGIDKNNVHDISGATPEQLQEYDILILGSSTWGYGDLQDDWEVFADKLQKMDLSDKKVALFGTGDSSSYPETFCDAIGILAEATEKAGATLIGKGREASEYSFDESRAANGDILLGLPLDEDNEPEKTNERISRWVEQLKAECE